MTELNEWIKITNLRNHTIGYRLQTETINDQYIFIEIKKINSTKITVSVKTIDTSWGEISEHNYTTTTMREAKYIGRSWTRGK